ncbi:hypothetical protein AK830_g8751 [Neonectria ditissima]|uniref:Uncharacterized protein n=1 Tax=Neonectria ditissima TaxID=78410 RepID=A0A0P7BBK5_9HYPO|nr:hypothetical protein AK830_g8751 [Neonectria ditissima]
MDPKNPASASQPGTGPPPKTMDNDSDSDSDSADDLLYPNDGTLASIIKSQTITLSITSAYSSAWSPVEAFRELVQNWRDGIIASFGLSEDHFQVIRQERAQLHNREILYQYKSHNGQGTVSIVNREATLKPWHLDLGGTTKSGVGNQAGAHGEGLKIALLVLQSGLRHYAVRCVSGGFNWRFDFNTRGKLVAHLRRMTRTQVDRVQIDHILDKSRTLLEVSEPSPLKDVHLHIGGKAKGRDHWGILRERKPVRLEDFNKWCEAALFLQDTPDHGIVRTSQGDLIIHPRLCDHLYLKGLLLQSSSNGASASITGRPLKFGYNFSNGVTNRERQSVNSAKEEGVAILNIWDQVLMKKPDYVIHLHEMLISSDREYADMLGAKQSMKIHTASRLRRHLFSDSTKWYYSPTENSKKNPRLGKTIQGLGRQGVEVPNTYWAVLEKFNLVRTADQEQRRRFLSAEVATVPHQEFAEEAVRLLRASLRGCTQTSAIAVQFVRAEELSLDKFYVEAEQVFKIHEKWLSKDSSIEELGLPQNLAERDVLFRVIKQLLSEILDEVPDDRFGYGENHTNACHKKGVLSCAEQRLLDYSMIRNSFALTAEIETQSTSRMTLQWDGDLSWGDDSLVTVQLHAELTCSHVRDLLLAKDFDSSIVTCVSVAEPIDDTIAAPDEEEPPVLDLTIPKCHELTCRIGAGSCSFDRLEAGVEYFAVMFKPSDADSVALASSPCVAVMPASQQQSPTAEPEILDRTAIETVPSTPTRPFRNRHQQRSTARGRGIATHTPARTAPRNSRRRIGDMSLRPGPRSESPSPAASPTSPYSYDTARETNLDEDVTRRSYTLGRALSTLDMLEARDWYEASNGGSRRVVIGITREESDHEGGRQKRQRTES